MKFSDTFQLMPDLLWCIRTAFLPTLSHIIESPSLLLKPKKLSQIFFYNVWKIWGDGANASSQDLKTALITPHAHGVVLDIGAGMGHTTQFLSKDKVTKYVALEPNTLMHPHIRKKAEEVGYTEEDGTLIILSCGAEAYEFISYALGGEHKVDTIISILSFCSVPQPEKTIEHLIDNVLKPGGELLFREHVAHKRKDVRFWQAVWNPMWTTLFDGCKLNHATDVYIQRLPFWQPFPEVDANGGLTGMWEENCNTVADETLFFHQVGRFIKRDV